ncbi:MAG: ABC transporter ATP-binding protein [Muribaculaceae bacterium]|nr:ABC transporter ATP-binding protein [Muribaculaceae bacterium]
MKNVIEINNLSKAYGNVQALDSVSFSVARGELFGLIGPDGAGKTTLFRLLTTLIRPDDGMATVEGLDIVHDYRAIREQVGYMPGRFSLYPDLTVEENLNFFAALFGTRVEESYDLVAPIYRQIEPFKKRRAGKLSGGMKQKLALSCALIHRPSVLFLDEPTTGVDAVSRSEFWDMLSELKTKGITILVSTPYMDEARRCDRIALCNEGRIMHIDTPQNIVGGFGGKLYAVAANNMFALLQAARSATGVAECYPFGDTHHLVAVEGFSAELFVSEMQGQMIKNLHIERCEPTIEDVFIKLMQR